MSPRGSKTAKESPCFSTRSGVIGRSESAMIGKLLIERLQRMGLADPQATMPAPAALEVSCR